MAYKSIVTDLTAQNATETTKTLVDTITVPQGCKKLVGVGSQVSSAGTTTLEDLTHIIEIESDDMAGWNGAQQFLGFGVATGNGAGWVGLNPFMHPTDIGVSGGYNLRVSVTFDRALTINPSTRVQLVFE